MPAAVYKIKPTGLNATELNKTEHNCQLSSDELSHKLDQSAAAFDVIRLITPSDCTQLKMQTDQRIFSQSQISENFRIFYDWLSSVLTNWALQVIKPKTTLQPR